jgi:hypothetical protein
VDYACAGGNWTIRLNITTANTNVTWSGVYICAVDMVTTTSTTLGSATGLGISCGTTGVKSTTVNTVPHNLGVNESVIVIPLFDNTNSMSNASVAHDVNTIFDTTMTTVIIAWTGNINLHGDVRILSLLPR